MPELQQATPEAFSKFNYATQFIDALCDVNLTTLDGTGAWWEGFIGAQMQRNEHEIQAHNQLLATRHHPDVNLQLTTHTVAKLSLKAPPPPKTCQDLSHILQCGIACTKIFFPKAQVTRTLTDIFDQLINQGAYQIDNSNAWCNYKPREIIYELLQLEQAEFPQL